MVQYPYAVPPRVAHSISLPRLVPRLVLTFRLAISIFTKNATAMVLSSR